MSARHHFGKWSSLVFLGIAVILAGCSKQPHGTADHSASHAAGDHSSSHDSTGQTKTLADHQHGAPAEKPLAATLHLQTSPERPMADEVAEILGMIHDQSGQMLKDFEVVHDKQIHLIMVRDGLDEFAHLHPSVDSDGNFAVSHTFDNGGTHHVFVDYKPVGKAQATVQGKLIVGGEAPTAKPLTPNVPGRVESGEVLAEITMDGSGASPVIRFTLLDSSGNPIADLQPYLGAMGHLVVIATGADQYVHAHPLESKPVSNIVEFEVHFPNPGVYKLWGQFQRNGKVQTIPAVVEFSGEVHQH